MTCRIPFRLLPSQRRTVATGCRLFYQLQNKMIKKYFTVFALLALFPLVASADTIFLKNGMRIDVKETWEEDGQIKCVMFGAVVGYPKEDVERIVKENNLEDSVPYSETSQVIKPLQKRKTGPTTFKERVVRTITGDTTFQKKNERDDFMSKYIKSEPESKPKSARYIWDRLEFHFWYDEYIDSLSLRYIAYVANSLPSVIVESKDRNILKMTQPKDHTSDQYINHTELFRQQALRKAWKYV